MTTFKYPGISKFRRGFACAALNRAAEKLCEHYEPGASEFCKWKFRTDEETKRNFLSGECTNDKAEMAGKDE